MKRTERIRFLNLPIDPWSMDETVDFVMATIESGGQVMHACVNAAITVLVHEDAKSLECVSKSDIINADGMSVIWASRLFGHYIPERVSGPDIMERVIEEGAKRKYRIYLFGASEEVVEKVAEIYSKRYYHGIIAGYRNGYFNKEEEKDIAAKIDDSKAEMLFVGMPSPMKEYFSHDNRQLMPNVNVLMGVGGAFDVIAGEVPRAPKWMQENGLEWLFRLKNEPRRLWKRYLFGNAKFILLVLRAWIFGPGNEGKVIDENRKG